MSESESKVVVGVVEGDVLDDPAEELHVGDELAVLDPPSYDAAEDAAEVLVAGVGEERARVGEHADEPRERREVGEVAQLLLHAEPVVVEPPRGADLDALRERAVRLEAARDGAHDLVVVLVERVEDDLRHRAGALERVEQPRERLRAAGVADRVEACVGAEGGEHRVGVVADAPVVELHDPAALRVLPGEVPEDRRAELVAVRDGDRLPGAAGAQDRVELPRRGLGADDAVEPVVGDAASPLREVLYAQVERLQEVGELRDPEPDDLLKRLDVPGERLLVHVERLVGAERGEHLHLARLVRRDLVVPLQGVHRVVRRADELYVRLLDDAPDGHRLPGEDLVALVVDSLCGLPVELLGYAEVVLELEVCPVVERVADEPREGLGPGLEGDERVGGAGDLGLREAARAHLPPLVVVAAEPHLGNCLVAPVLRDVAWVDVAVVVDYGHLRGVAVVQRPRRRGVQQEVLVQKLLHSSCSLLFHVSSIIPQQNFIVTASVYLSFSSERTHTSVISYFPFARRKTFPRAASPPRCDAMRPIPILGVLA